MSELDKLMNERHLSMHRVSIHKLTHLQLLGVFIATIATTLLVIRIVTGTFLGAPNQYNHLAWQGDGIQSWAYPEVRPWDAKVYGGQAVGTSSGENAVDMSSVMKPAPMGDKSKTPMKMNGHASGNQHNM